MLFTLMVGTIFTILITGYFFPYLVALGLNSKRISSLAGINLLTGWTVVGWFAGIVFAFSWRQPKAKVGRIFFALALFAILGYLFAYFIGDRHPDVVAHFDALVAAK